MAHINLLPWREERRAERQKQFYVILIAGLVFAALALYLVMIYSDSFIEQQKDRNTFLQQQVTKLDKKIKEIKNLEKKKNRLLARMQVIQELQQSRPRVVKIYDSLVRTVPDGIYLKRVIRKGTTLTLEGIAESNARVSVFMRHLEARPEFSEAKLRVIKRTSTKNDAIRQFTLEVHETKLAKTEGEE